MQVCHKILNVDVRGRCVEAVIDAIAYHVHVAEKVAIAQDLIEMLVLVNVLALIKGVAAPGDVNRLAGAHQPLVEATPAAILILNEARRGEASIALLNLKAIEESLEVIPGARSMHQSVEVPVQDTSEDAAAFPIFETGGDAVVPRCIIDHAPVVIQVLERHRSKINRDVLVPL